jgi:Ca2+-binding RTX toxin-like protein
MSDIFGDDNNNNLTDTESADYILGFAGNDTLSGLGGDDIIEGGNDIDNLFGGNGNDALFGGEENDFLYGENNDDILADNNGTNILDGGGGNDTLYGGKSNILLGGEGNDRYIFSGNEPIGNNLIEDAAGIETIEFAVSKISIDFDLGITINQIVNSNLTLSLSNGNQIENAIGSYDSDSIVGNALSNVLQGGNINDSLYGADIALLDKDYLEGKDDDDTLLGWYGDDTLDGGKGNDTLDGGVGKDTIGNNLNNGLFGNSNNNQLEGGAGNDYLGGSVGSDYLDGGTGNDTLEGGIGGDIYIIDSVSDIIIEPGFAEDPNPSPTELVSIVNAILEYDRVFASVDYFLNENVEELNLTGTADITGSGNYLDNTLVGNDGDNTLTGFAGNDTLVGGAGDDTLTGGTGGDKFMFTGDTPFTRFGKTLIDPNYGVDRISDFSSEDVIVLDKTVFSSLQSIVENGFSVASEFAAVTSDAEAATSRGSIVYSQATGNLFYNQNSTNPDLGSGGWFATVANAPILTAEDFTLMV